MKNTFLRLWHYIGKYKPLLFLSAFSAIVSVICTLIAPLVIGQIVDMIAQPYQVALYDVLRLLFVLAAIYLGSSLFLWLLSRLTNEIAYRTVNGLRRALFDKLTVLPLGFYDRTPHGDTTSRFINDVDTISDGLLQGTLTLLQGVVTIIGAIFFMLRLNPSMTLVVVLSAPASFLVARRITIKSQQLFREQAKYLGELSGYAEEIIEGQKTVNAFGYESRAHAHFEEINHLLYKAGVESQYISSLSNPSTRIVNNSAYAIIGVIGAVSAIYGRISAGDILSFLIYATVFSKPFNDMTNVLTQIQAATACAQRVFHLLDLAPEPAESSVPQKLENCTGHVQFRDVSFSYQPEQRLIEHFNLDVAPGSRVAIVGRTGAGKTTLINLLMRFYDVSGGSILVDGIDIRDLTRQNLREQFGMVAQDIWLFEGSIRDNIAYARPDASMEEIVHAAKSAGADGFIRRLSKGYDTIISADADNLSQGQKQLLTIARVMLANPPMLILDEATSNIDTYTEMRIQRAFAKLTAGRTSFVIAHRLSTIKNSDLILVMQDGQVVESGNHEQLLEKGGYYATLYNSQFAPADA